MMLRKKSELSRSVLTAFIPLALALTACGSDDGSSGSNSSSATSTGGSADEGSGGSGEASGGDSASGGASETGGSTSTGGSPSTSGGLTPPEDGKGVQLATPEFVLHPGEEMYKCYQVEVPADTEVDIARFTSKMAAGSHHFILYQADKLTAPSGTLQDHGCAAGIGSQWVFASGAPDTDMPMPEGVAMPFKAHQALMFDMHYINTTQEDLHAHVAINLEYAQGEHQKAGSLISFNFQINVPAHGTQTVGGDCKVPADAKFFVMSTHTHKNATVASIHRKLADGSMGEELVHTTDWEHPDVWAPKAPGQFLTFAPGEKFNYSCSYKNDTDANITVGESAAKNEMCMAVTYYFPKADGIGFCTP